VLAGRAREGEQRIQGSFSQIVRKVIVLLIPLLCEISGMGVYLEGMEKRVTKRMTGA